MVIRWVSIFLLCVLTLMFGAQAPVRKPTKLIHPEGKSVYTRFSTPAGFNRLPLDTGDFNYYLRHMIPLKKDGSPVYLYNGMEKNTQMVHEAVLDLDVGNKDLQQCADAVIRLRAEFLFKIKRFEYIHFNFTNGFCASYVKWAEGNRIKVKGNEALWYKHGLKDYSYTNFRKYLDVVFNYAGSLSLSREMEKISPDHISPGDVFIQGGSPGHAVIVMDAAVNSSGKRIFILAQSYMPAQDIHILKNTDNPNLSPWFDIEKTETLNTPEWTFNKGDLKRFVYRKGCATP